MSKFRFLVVLAVTMVCGCQTWAGETTACAKHVDHGEWIETVDRDVYEMVNAALESKSLSSLIARIGDPKIEISKSQAMWVHGRYRKTISNDCVNKPVERLFAEYDLLKITSGSNGVIQKCQVERKVYETGGLLPSPIDTAGLLPFMGITVSCREWKTNYLRDEMLDPSNVGNSSRE